MKHPGLGIQSATFVHWQNRGETGRPVELDNLNRVKAVVCVGALREALDLRHASIIHPDVGCWNSYVAVSWLQNAKYTNNASGNLPFTNYVSTCFT